MRLAILLLVVGLIAAGCAAADTAPQDDNNSDPSGEPTATSSSPPTTVVDPPEVDPATTPDLAVYLAAIEEAMEGTGYEGAALEDPEVFIGVGQLFCERLGDGATIDDVLAEYLDGVADDTGTVSDEDAQLAGVILGVATEVICPDPAAG